jgi:hypothetical protein
MFVTALQGSYFIHYFASLWVRKQQEKRYTTKKDADENVP